MRCMHTETVPSFLLSREGVVDRHPCRDPVTDLIAAAGVGHPSHWQMRSVLLNARKWR